LKKTFFTFLKGLITQASKIYLLYWVISESC